MRAAALALALLVPGPGSASQGGAPRDDAAPRLAETAGPVWIAGDAFDLRPHRGAFAGPCLALEVWSRDGAPADRAATAPGPCDPPDLALALIRDERDEAAQSLPLAERARAARTLALSGSPSAVDWYECLAPSGESRLLRALRSAHAAGATAVGRGRAGALLGTWLVVAPDELERVERNPRRVGRERMVAGLGLLEWGLVEAGEGATLRRAVVACIEERLRWAAYVPPRSALACDPSTGRAEVHGPDPVVVLDLRGARRMRNGLRDVRVSLLADGDTWDHADRSARLAGDSAELPDGRAGTFAVVEDALDPAAWTRAVATLAARSGGSGGTGTARWRDRGLSVALRGGRGARVAADGRAGNLLADLQLDPTD